MVTCESKLQRAQQWVKQQHSILRSPGYFEELYFGGKRPKPHDDQVIMECSMAFPCSWSYGILLYGWEAIFQSV